ncbi:MAG: PD-(D/E)XK motif protein, partial [Opitutaceae bacterium]|nr:PD-(D/E)XK motif protein [Cytophagales bacterium]
MTKINEIWYELENDTSSSTGLLLRRYSSAILTDVYIALRKSEKTRCIALKLKNDNVLNLARYANLKDIKAELIPDEKDSTKNFLLILLSNKLHEDIFASLCEDLINGISTFSDEKIVVQELLNRLEKWKSLFDKASAEGLSPEEQRGLYGELFFLRKWILESNNLKNTLQSWVGPELAIRDFQLSDWALEVKTTHGNNHQKIQINSERQLDTENLNSLILYHLSLEVQQQNGQTLNSIAEEIIQ